MCGRSDVAFGCQMGQKLPYFFGAHFKRMPFAMEDDEPSHPLDISSLGAYAVMTIANLLSHLIQKLGFCLGWVRYFNSAMFGGYGCHI